jgi:hypothetical protein
MLTLRRSLLSLVTLWEAITASSASAQEKPVVGLVPEAQKPIAMDGKHSHAMSAVEPFRAYWAICPGRALGIRGRIRRRTCSPEGPEEIPLDRLASLAGPVERAAIHAVRGGRDELGVVWHKPC